MSIHEVAKRASVSTATVSRTMNSPHLVDPGTAARVQKAIEELNYVPDTHARTLVSGHSHMLGLIVSDITNPFFPELVKGFGDIAVDAGYDILVGSSDYSCERMELCVRRMLERKVDGIAIMTSEREPRLINQLGQHSIPIAFLDTGPIGKHFRNIEVDYAQGIGEALDHLISLGHERFLFIGGPSQLPSAQMRHCGFLEHLRRRAIDDRNFVSVNGNLTVDGGRAAMESILASADPPTGVIAANDLSAIGALRAVHGAGWRVPEFVSIIGFDDIHLAEFTEPPLTSIRLDREEVATRAVSWLVADIEDRRLPNDALSQPIPTRLVLRQTTGVARKNSSDPLSHSQ